MIFNLSTCHSIMFVILCFTSDKSSQYVIYVSTFEERLWNVWREGVRVVSSTSLLVAWPSVGKIDSLTCVDLLYPLLRVPPHLWPWEISLTISHTLLSLGFKSWERFGDCLLKNSNLIFLVRLLLCQWRSVFWDVNMKVQTSNFTQMDNSVVCCLKGLTSNTLISLYP